MINCSHTGLFAILWISRLFYWLYVTFIPLLFSISASLDASLISWPLFKSHLSPEVILDHQSRVFFPAMNTQNNSSGLLLSNYLCGSWVNNKELYKSKVPFLSLYLFKYSVRSWRVEDKCSALLSVPVFSTDSFQRENVFRLCYNLEVDCSPEARVLKPWSMGWSYWKVMQSSFRGGT